MLSDIDIDIAIAIDHHRFVVHVADDDGASSPPPSSSSSSPSSSSVTIPSSSPSSSSSSSAVAADMVAMVECNQDPHMMRTDDVVRIRVPDHHQQHQHHHHHHRHHHDHCDPPATGDDGDGNDDHICKKTFVIEARNLSYRPPNQSRSARPSSMGMEMEMEMKKKKGFSSFGRKLANNNESPMNGFILKGVSCIARPGEILAIAGPSGAGKSTLLEILGGRLHYHHQEEEEEEEEEEDEGNVVVNHRAMSAATLRRISGFIPQTDVVFPLLTVRETLMFSARLRLPGSATARAEMEARVDALLSELGLSHVSGSRVGGGDGNNVRGISGGERRRVSIGVDAVHDPAVLLLDEPTSGLDSTSALHVLHMLHSMAKARSRTVILTIHQPGFRIMQLIHSYLLLDRGQVVHHGSLAALERKLAAAGHALPPHVNALEYVMEEMRSGLGDMMKKAALVSAPTRNGGAPFALYKEKHEGPLLRCLCGGGGGGGGGAMVANADEEMATLTLAKPRFANDGLHEVAVLAHRFTLNVFRDRSLLASRTIQALVAGLALGSLYRDVGMGPSGIAERLGFLAFMLTFLLSSSIEALPIFLKERAVLLHETSRGAYRISSYLLAHFLVFVPFLLFIAMVFSIPAYFLIGLARTPSAFAFFVLTVWLVLLMANSFVAFFSALAPDYIMGSSLVSGAMGAFFLFSGYFISRENMPDYWRFMHYISLFKYPLDALLVNEYSSMHAPHDCLVHGAASSMSVVGGTTCMFTAQDELRSLGLDPTWKWPSIAVIVGFLAFYRLLCYIVLKIKLSKITNSSS